MVSIPNPAELLTETKLFTLDYSGVSGVTTAETNTSQRHHPES